MVTRSFKGIEMNLKGFLQIPCGRVWMLCVCVVFYSEVDWDSVSPPVVAQSVNGVNPVVERRLFQSVFLVLAACLASPSGQCVVRSVQGEVLGWVFHQSYSHHKMTERVSRAVGGDQQVKHRKQEGNVNIEATCWRPPCWRCCCTSAHQVHVTLIGTCWSRAEVQDLINRFLLSAAGESCSLQLTPLIMSVVVLVVAVQDDMMLNTVHR